MSLRIDRHGRRVAGGVLIPRIESRHETRGEREIRPLETGVGLSQILSEDPLLLVKTDEPLGGDRRNEEEQHRPRRQLNEGVRQDRDQRREERERPEKETDEPRERLSEMRPRGVARSSSTRALDRSRPRSALRSLQPAETSGTDPHRRAQSWPRDPPLPREESATSSRPASASRAYENPKEERNLPPTWLQGGHKRRQQKGSEARRQTCADGNRPERFAVRRTAATRARRTMAQRGWPSCAPLRTSPAARVQHSSEETAREDANWRNQLEKALESPPNG